jgi:hypothetical protein
MTQKEKLEMDRRGWEGNNQQLASLDLPVGYRYVYRISWLGLAFGFSSRR